MVCVVYKNTRMELIPYVPSVPFPVGVVKHHTRRHENVSADGCVDIDSCVSYYIEVYVTRASSLVG